MPSMRMRKNGVWGEMCRSAATAQASITWGDSARGHHEDSDGHATPWTKSLGVRLLRGLEEGQRERRRRWCGKRRRPTGERIVVATATAWLLD